VFRRSDLRIANNNHAPRARRSDLRIANNIHGPRARRSDLRIANNIHGPRARRSDLQIANNIHGPRARVGAIFRSRTATTPPERRSDLQIAIHSRLRVGLFTGLNVSGSPVGDVAPTYAPWRPLLRDIHPQEARLRGDVAPT
jgi:hypothetical protein